MPGGLGARELVLGLTLATLLTGPALVTVVALSRILVTVTDAANGFTAASTGKNQHRTFGGFDSFALLRVELM